MATSIAVSEETRKRLMQLKLEEGSRSLDELLQGMLARYRKMKFLEASDLFRRRLADRKLRFEDLVR